MIRSVLGFAAAALAGTLLLAPAQAPAVDISYRSFSGSATMGPQGAAYAAKLEALSKLTLGAGNEVRFLPLAGVPAVPTQFGGSIVAAVAAGSKGGGFDAAYNSGSELNKTWGFLYNSGFPFGPGFEEFLGFLYGKSIDGKATGLELLQRTLDARDRNVVVLPIVGSSEQLSGYFSKPLSDVPGAKGIGLAGFCQQPWTLRYLPPAENVLGLACDELVKKGTIKAKGIKFIAAIPGGGSLVDAVKAGQLQGFEFATPLDDVSQLFKGTDNPGTVGLRYVHLPGWQQQFLVTWLIVNKEAWGRLTPAQQALAYGVARDHVLDSYGENMRRQGEALAIILNANKEDADPKNDMVLTQWPEKDQALLSDATARFLTARLSDANLPAEDREDLGTILEALRKYIRGNDGYWDRRGVQAKMRFDAFLAPASGATAAK